MSGSITDVKTKSPERVRLFMFRSQPTQIRRATLIIDPKLYPVEPSGDGLAQLTFGAGNWGDPLPSPDGRFVAGFRGPELWLPYPADLVPAPRPELWLMRADGSGVRLVSPNAAGAY